MDDILTRLYRIAADRKINPEEGSYTCYLYEKGLDKILKKVGEECAETIVAAKNGSSKELTFEICDLIYHLIVLMNQCNLPIEDIFTELETRAKKIGNLKEIKSTDKNT
ncbi:MAG: phosphoribosyl-ATP diphosphatase [Oscillospiraceae bacterium]|nr:phosphoribosyl-ATP diphosphatase [Oscillospiraceae bacterium]